MDVVSTVEKYLGDRKNMSLTVKNISRKTDLTRKQVKYALRALEALGDVQKTIRSSANMTKKRPVYAATLQS